jgi:RecA/RadA recombinase
MALFDKIKKISGNKYAFKIGEQNPYEVGEWVDTGCFALNAVLSDGDIFKGLPTGKRIMISGESGVAKSLFTAFIIKAYLDRKPGSKAVFFESEGSSTIEMAKTVGIEDDQMVILPVMTVEDCRTQFVNIIDAVIDAKEKGEEADFIFVIDSIGMLGTNKETTDIAEGSDTKDMTRAQLLKGFARVTSLKLSIAQCPLILVNHGYKEQKKFPKFIVSGGQGMRYMSDVSLVLTKAKEKEGTNQTGVIITLNVDKSRYMQENKKIKVLISFQKGILPYSDMVNKAYEFGVLKKEGISFLFPNGVDKVKMKEVRKHAKKYLEYGDIMQMIRDAIKNDFSFGSENEEDIEEFESDEETTFDDGE